LINYLQKKREAYLQIGIDFEKMGTQFMISDEKEAIRNEIKKAYWIKFNDFEPQDHTFASSVPTLVKMIESKGTKTSPYAHHDFCLRPEIIFDNCRFVYSKKENQVYRYPIRDPWAKKGPP